MKRIMRAFKMTELSAVDRPAQAHAKVTIMKRDAEGLSDYDLAFIGKRDFSASERRHDAKTGAAMADGSFPIENAEDLSNAMRLAGHAKDPAAARRHIKARAKALGLESHLSGAYSKAILEEADAALLKVRHSLSTNDIAGLLEAGQDYREYLDGVLPAEIVKAHRAKTGGAQGDENMTTAEVQKAIDEALAPLKAEIEKAKKPKMNDGDGDEAGDGEDGADGKGKRPGKKDGEKADKRLDDAFAKLAAQDVLIKGFQEREEIREFQKKATDLGLQEVHGEVLRKAYKGDKDGIAKLEQLMKGLAEAARLGKVFEEFGSAANGAPATASAEMDAKVAELRKADPKLSKAAAFTKVYTDSANADLKARYDAETSPLAKRRA